jgi:hypothetical protein
MPFATENVLEMLMAINSFGPRFDPQSIPSYSDWLANHTFDPFGPDPFSPIPTAYPGIPFHSQSQGESRVKEGTNVGSRVDRGQRSSEDMLQVPKEVSDLPLVDHDSRLRDISQRSRFAFAQERVGQTVDRSRVPVQTKATPTRVPRVVGPRPPRYQRGSCARHEPPLVIPKAGYPLPTWLTRFEDHEDKLLAEFCPPSEGSTSPISDSLSGSPESGSGCADGEVSGWYSAEEEVEDRESFEFGAYSDSESESSAPASYWSRSAAAFDWPAPYQDSRVEGYSRVGAVTPHEFLPEGSPSLSWSVFAGPPVDGPTTASPARSSSTSFSVYDFADDDMEEGDGVGSGSSPGSLLGSYKEEEEGWCDRFDLTGYTSLPQQLWSLRMAAGLEPPSLMYPVTIQLPNLEEDEDAELDAIVVSPQSPAFDWVR